MLLVRILMHLAPEGGDDMLSKAELEDQKKVLQERISALKQEISDNEPTVDDIVRFVQENHPKKQTQRLFEQELRQAQNDLADLEEQ